MTNLSPTRTSNPANASAPVGTGPSPTEIGQALLSLQGISLTALMQKLGASPNAPPGLSAELEAAVQRVSEAAAALQAKAHEALVQGAKPYDRPVDPATKPKALAQLLVDRSAELGHPVYADLRGSPMVGDAKVPDAMGRTLAGWRELDYAKQVRSNRD